MVAGLETFEGSLDDVRAFCAVVDFHTISAAARQRNETKGSVSRRIARLERALGIRLLARTPRAVRPSNEGLDFYEKASAALSLLDEATGKVRKASSILRGPIRITSSVDFAVEVLPDILARFRREHPQITIEVLSTNDILDLTAHRVDLALRVAWGRLRDSRIHAMTIAPLDVGVFAAPDYLHRCGEPGCPSELTAHDLILPPQRPGRTHLVLSNGDREEKIMLNAAVRSADFASVLRLAVAGAGIAYLPILLARRWMASGHLVRLLPAWKRAGVTLYAVSAPSRQLTARVRTLRDYICDGIKEMEFSVGGH